MNAVLLAMALAAAPDSSGARPITLGQAIEMAWRNAPQMVQAQGRTRTAAAGVRSAYAQFLPSASVSANSTRQLPAGARTRVENGQIVTVPSQPWSYNLGFNASVDLFSGGRRFNGVREARAQANAASADAVSQRFDTELTVKQSYFDVLAARESQLAAESQLAVAQRQLQSSAARYRARTVTRSDSLRAAIQFGNAQLANVDARTALAVANASLTRIVGSSEPVTAAAEDDTLDRPLPITEAQLLALAEDGPAVRSARANDDAARASLRASYGAYLPTVSAGYSRGGSAVGETLFPSGEDFNNSGSVRLSLSYPLFNQLQREQQVVQARAAAENATAALRDARLAARSDLIQRLGAFRSAREKVEAQTATLAAAEEDLRVQQERYAVGGSTQLDVLTSQTQLDQARRDLIRARYDLRIARAQLSALVAREL